MNACYSYKFATWRDSCLRGSGPSRCRSLDNICPKRVRRLRSYKSWRVDSEFLVIKSMPKMSTYEGTKANKRQQIIQHITRGESCQWTHKGRKICALLAGFSENDAIISVINVNSFRDLVYILPNELAYGVCKASNYWHSHIRGLSYIPTLVWVVLVLCLKVTFLWIEGTFSVHVSPVEVFVIRAADSLAVISPQILLLMGLEQGLNIFSSQFYLQISATQKRLQRVGHMPTIARTASMLSLSSHRPNHVLSPLGAPHPLKLCLTNEYLCRPTVYHPKLYCIDGAWTSFLHNPISGSLQPRNAYSELVIRQPPQEFNVVLIIQSPQTIFIDEFWRWCFCSPLSSHPRIKSDDCKPLVPRTRS